MIFDCKFCSVSLVTLYMLIYCLTIQNVDSKAKPKPIPGRKKGKVKVVTKQVEYEPIVLSPEEREKWLRGEVDMNYGHENETTVDWYLRKRLRLATKQKLRGIIYARHIMPRNETTRRHTTRQRAPLILKDDKPTTEKESKRAKKRKIVQNYSWVEESLRPYLLQLSTLPAELFTVNKVVLNKRNVVAPLSKNVTGTIIFLHGEGIKAGSMKVWLENVSPFNHVWKHTRVVFPTSPFQVYTVCERDLFYVWFDRDTLLFNGTENVASIDQTAEKLMRIINNEVKNGIPMNKIVIGGYGMGGSMALHMAYRYLPHVAGVFAMGSFLNEESAVYTELEKNQSLALPPVYFIHGALDHFVPIKWSRTTYKKLLEYGVPGEYEKVAEEGHGVDYLQTALLFRWIKKILPDE